MAGAGSMGWNIQAGTDARGMQAETKTRRRQKRSKKGRPEWNREIKSYPHAGDTGQDQGTQATCRGHRPEELG